MLTVHQSTGSEGENAMIKYVAVLLTASLSATTAFADETQTKNHEAIGFGSGAVIGGIAGGPIGVVLGAAAGAWLGDRYNEERTARLDFEQRWTLAAAEVDELNGLVLSSERRVSTLESELRQQSREMNGMVRDALDVRVLFRTNESTLPEETEARLTRLAELLASMDGMLVRIEGHADARGNAEHNEQLSAQRAVAVRDTLIQAGVPASRITVDAHGERYSSAEESDVDALAMERRVDLTLIRNGDESRIAQK